MEDPTGAETPEASDVWEEETYPIMAINMKCKTPRRGYEKGAADRQREVIISTIHRSSASVIFCQDAPGHFEKKVVEKCVNEDYSYKFVPKDISSGKRDFKVAVMWRETDFESKEVELTESSFTKIEERLKQEKSDVDLSMSMERSAMVKLTSKGTTKASFLAVSWHGPEENDEASKAFYGLICIVREVCENEKLSWFIIGAGGDFKRDTSKVDLTEYDGVTVSRHPFFVPSKDADFVFSVSSNKHPSTVDITVSEVKPLKLENGSSKNEPLRHVPVVGKVKCRYNEPFIMQDRASTSCSSQSPSAIPDSYATLKDFQRLFSLVKTSFDSIHAKIDRLTAEVAEIKTSCSRQSSSAIPDGYVTRKDFERLLNLVERSFNSIHVKIDPLTAEVEEIKLAIKRLDGSIPREREPTEPHSQTTKASRFPVLK